MREKYIKDLVVGDKTEQYEVLKVWNEGDKIVAEVKFNDGGTAKRVWDSPTVIINVVEKLFKLEWGISPPREVAIAWGARAIYHGPGSLDIVWDRQDAKGGTPEQCKELTKWLNEYGIPHLKKMTRDESLYGNEHQQISDQLHGWYITANPRGSYGYLYIGVYPTDGGDPTFVPAPVPSPKPVVLKPAKTVKLKRKTPRQVW